MSLLRRFTGIGLALCLTAPSYANLSINFYTNGGVPAYFSGSNSRVDVKVLVQPGGAPIASVLLKLNNEVIATWTSPPPPPPPAVPQATVEVRMPLMFDSTHWAMGATNKIVATCEAIDAAGVHYASSAAPVELKNIASILSIYEWETTESGASGAMAKTHLDAVGYDTSRWRFDPSWDELTVDEFLSECSAFHIQCHGELDLLSLRPVTNDHLFYALPDPSWPSALESRVGALGSGLPPFNSTGVPPVTAAFLDCCYTGGAPHFATGILFPQKNWFSGGAVENQAEIGWTVKTYVPDGKKYSNMLWGALEEGHSAIDATKLTGSDYAYYEGERGSTWKDVIACWGDPATRLKGVYDGTESGVHPGTWFRPIVVN